MTRIQRRLLTLAMFAVAATVIIWQAGWLVLVALSLWTFANNIETDFAKG